MQFITLLDFVLLPFYLVTVYLIAYNFRNRKYPVGHSWRPYFIPGLTVKISGAIFIGLVYQYYYHGGDTSNYFSQGEILNSSFHDSAVKWINLLFRIPEWYENGYYQYTSQFIWYRTSVHLIVAITAVSNILGCHHFLPSSVIFASVSFTGIWAIFRTFALQYPKLLKPIAVCTLFIPSVFIWGSGIFKDTMCMFGLGWMLYTTFRVLLLREFKPSNIILFVVGFYLIAIIKVYILLAFIPALALWIMFTYSSKIKSSLLKISLNLVLGLTLALVFYLVADSLGSELGTYSLDNITKTTTTTRDYIYGITDESGSAYDLGEIEPNIGSLLAKFPQSVNVALFRPYLWEANKPIVFFNALEALAFLIVTIMVLFSLGPVKIWKAIRSDPTIQFCLIFSLIFAFAVGISSGNFGALSRYRIPCLPMYAVALVLINGKYAPTNNLQSVLPKSKKLARLNQSEK
jgi:hypothetical protein